MTQFYKNYFFQWPLAFCTNLYLAPTLGIASCWVWRGTVKECQESPYGFLAEEARMEVCEHTQTHMRMYQPSAQQVHSWLPNPEPWGQSTLQSFMDVRNQGKVRYCYSNFKVQSNLPRICWNTDSNLAGLGWDPRFCISNRLLCLFMHLSTLFIYAFVHYWICHALRIVL